MPGIQVIEQQTVEKLFRQAEGMTENEHIEPHELLKLYGCARDLAHMADDLEGQNRLQRRSLYELRWTAIRLLKTVFPALRIP